VLLLIGEEELNLIRHARARARERTWRAGAGSERVILDFDSTPSSVHSETAGCRERPSPYRELYARKTQRPYNAAGKRNKARRFRFAQPHEGLGLRRVAEGQAPARS
jgi:hypothetical protein